MVRHGVQTWLESRPWIDRDSANIDEYVAGLQEHVDFDLATKLREWQERGVVMFERAVDIQLIEALLADIEYLRKHPRDFELGVEIRGLQTTLREVRAEDLTSSGVKFNSIQTLSRAASLLSLTREVVIFLRHVFASPPCVMQSLTFYLGSEQPIHIDYPYVRCQTKLAHLAATWIPLEDIDPDAGPLAYYPGSHRAGVAGFFDWGDGSILYEPDSIRTPTEFAEYLYVRMREKGVEREVFLPRRGDVLIWHGGLAHEGTPIRREGLTRKSYATHYTSLEAYPIGHMKPRAVENGLCVSAHGGYVFEFPWLKDPRRLPSWDALNGWT